MQKADNDVGNLDAGVVDVVLHVDFAAGGAEQADKRVAEDCVAKMADVRGLVGIDGGMFDKGMSPLSGRRTPGRNDKLNSLGAVEIRVDVAGAGDFEFGEARERAEGGNDFLSDDLRRLAEFARQLESDGRGDLAEMQIGRRLQSDGPDL